MEFELAWIIAGALVGGFVNGLTGFGTALAAMPLWLQTAPPALAAQLAAGAGVVGQLLTLHRIWHAISWRRVGTYILAGLAGVPAGTLLLPHIALASFKLGVGVLLIGYTSFMLFGGDRWRVAAGGRLAEMFVGFGGGFLGGLAGLSGVLPTVWASLKGLPKDERRALFQTFNLAVLGAMLAASAVSGLMTRQFWTALLFTIPATIAGAHGGYWVYTRLDDRRFDRLVLVLLLGAGFSLVAAGM